MGISNLFRVGLIYLALSFPAHAFSEVVLIVSPNNPLVELSAEQAADIFLGRAGSLPDGSSLLPVDLPEGTTVRREFYQKLTGKSMPWLKAYWSKLIFTGRGEPPKELNDDAAVKKLVAEDPRFIGYIEKKAVDPSVKVVLTVH